MIKKYQDWWSKVTISDLRTNVALLQQSAGHDLSKFKKSARGNISKDGSDFKDRDDDVEHTGEFIDTPVASTGEGVIENDNSDQDSEANFKRYGRKKRKIVAANTSRMALGDSFFNDIQSCSDMPTNLEDVTCFPFCSESCKTYHVKFIIYLTFFLLYFGCRLVSLTWYMSLRLSWMKDCLRRLILQPSYQWVKSVLLLART